MTKGERLIPLDEAPRRGEILLGEIETDQGPRQHVIHWRRQKRINYQVARSLNEPYVFRSSREVFLRDD